MNSTINLPNIEKRNTEIGIILKKENQDIVKIAKATFLTLKDEEFIFHGIYYDFLENRTLSCQLKLELGHLSKNIEENITLSFFINHKTKKWKAFQATALTAKESIQMIAWNYFLLVGPKTFIDHESLRRKNTPLSEKEIKHLNFCFNLHGFRILKSLIRDFDWPLIKKFLSLFHLEYPCHLTLSFALHAKTAKNNETAYHLTEVVLSHPPFYKIAFSSKTPTPFKDLVKRQAALLYLLMAVSRPNERFIAHPNKSPKASCLIQ